MKSIAVLGSTGSIGTQALDVARWRGYRVVGLAAGTNSDLLVSQAEEFRPSVVSCAAEVADAVRPHLPAGTRLVTGAGASDAVATAEADVIVAAIPGMAGLGPTTAALRAGRHVALANKEALVVAGSLVMALATEHGARITPVDSEHSGLHQCLQGEPREAVAALVLTASGGPFLDGPASLSSVTPEQALRHPNWSMGQKVTIDSATLFNKGLEVLEAHFLFAMPLDRIEVVIHPQSLVHALVRFTDGSIKAQLGPHDMRLPIQYALEGPSRPETPLSPLSLVGLMHFLIPDVDRFPCLPLAYRAGAMGGVAPAYLNAADEVAVAAFLAGTLPFDGIASVIASVLDAAPNVEVSWDAIAAADTEARALAHGVVRAIARRTADEVDSDVTRGSRTSATSSSESTT
ncbi:MAG TPA: 1-deoxy-D-xylulose-5-phosphate reductoisomerase [Trueperaceae bacterium]|nr:1-deoxy-D-xylulose-5-phosphate reductoisomerase [Trueperaceae bacterium]